MLDQLILAHQGNHPLRQRLENVRTLLNTQQNAVDLLRKHIVDALLQWHEELHGIDWPISLRFVWSGVREKLQDLLPQTFEHLSIDASGFVVLEEQTARTHIGNIRWSGGSAWARQPFVNNNFACAGDNFVFIPARNDSYIAPEDVEGKGPGPFVLNAEEERAAMAAMVEGYIGAYGRIALSIHADEEPGQYCDVRAMLNLEDMFDACRWVEDHLNPEALRVTSAPSFALLGALAGSGQPFLLEDNRPRIP